MLLLPSTGILVPSPYFLSLFYPSLGGTWANGECPFHGWHWDVSSSAVPAHSARRDRGQAVKAAQVGLFEGAVGASQRRGLGDSLCAAGVAGSDLAVDLCSV